MNIQTIYDNKFKNSGNEYRLFGEIMLRSCSRVSAVLRLTGRNVLPDGRVLIPQDKGSNILQCTLVWCSDLVHLIAGNDLPLFPNLTYVRVYRDFKRWGLYYQSAGNTDFSVTHYFRKVQANDLYLQTRDASNVTAILGHKSSRTADYYIEDKRKGLNVSGGILQKTEGTINNLRITRGGVIYIAQEKVIKKLHY